MIKTQLFFPNVEADIPALLELPQFASCVIHDVRSYQIEVLGDDDIMRVVDRVEIDYEPNDTGIQVVLPTTQERLQAAETLINLILDEEGE